MQYFLVKTDPDTYSVEDFVREGTTLWDGVHSFAAIGFIKQMKPGDLVYVYESLTTKSVVGLAEVADEPFLNTADPRTSWAVKLKFLRRLTPVSLAQIKAEPQLKEFDLVRQSRLSVMKVPPAVQDWLSTATNG